MEKVYTVSEVADMLECHEQTLRDQVNSDIAQGRNGQNFNAFKVGNKLLFPKKWFDKKLGVGPVVTVPDWFAALIARLGMAVEVTNDQS